MAACSGMRRGQQGGQGGREGGRRSEEDRWAGGRKAGKAGGPSKAGKYGRRRGAVRQLGGASNRAAGGKVRLGCERRR